MDLPDDFRDILVCLHDEGATRFGLTHRPLSEIRPLPSLPPFNLLPSAAGTHNPSEGRHRHPIPRGPRFQPGPPSLTKDVTNGEV